MCRSVREINVVICGEQPLFGGLWSSINKGNFSYLWKCLPVLYAPLDANPQHAIWTARFIEIYLERCGFEMVN
jgi:hypothetical protein